MGKYINPMDAMGPVVIGNLNISNLYKYVYMYIMGIPHG